MTVGGNQKNDPEKTVDKRFFVIYYIRGVAFLPFMSLLYLKNMSCGSCKLSAGQGIEESAEVYRAG